MTIEEGKLIKSIKTQNIIMLLIGNISSIAFLVASVIVLLDGRKIWWLYFIFAVLFHATLDFGKKE